MKYIKMVALMFTMVSMFTLQNAYANEYDFDQELYNETQEKDMNIGFYMEGIYNGDNGLILDNDEVITLRVNGLTKENEGDLIGVDCYGSFYSFKVKSFYINGKLQEKQFIKDTNKYNRKNIEKLKDKGYEIIAGSYYKGKLYTESKFFFHDEGKEIYIDLDEFIYNGENVLVVLKDNKVISTKIY